MTNETPTIQAQARDRLGSRYAQRLRKDGRLPAVIYGHKIDPVAVHIDAKETITHLQRGVHVVNVALDGAGNQTCLVKELQFGYLGDNVIHIDFARVNLDEEVSVKVHIRFIGSPESAKQAGAVLSYDMAELDVICKVSSIPGEIRIDLSKMEQSMTVGELKLPEGVRAADPPHTLVAHIGFVAEEAVGEQVAPDAAAVAEPEVITEKKPDEAPAKEE